MRCDSKIRRFIKVEEIIHPDKSWGGGPIRIALASDDEKNGAEEFPKERQARDLFCAREPPGHANYILESQINGYNHHMYVLSYVKG